MVTHKFLCGLLGGRALMIGLPPSASQSAPFRPCSSGDTHGRLELVRDALDQLEAIRSPGNGKYTFQSIWGRWSKIGRAACSGSVFCARCRRPFLCPWRRACCSAKESVGSPLWSGIRRSVWPSAGHLQLDLGWSTNWPQVRALCSLLLLLPLFVLARDIAPKLAMQLPSCSSFRSLLGDQLEYASDQETIAQQGFLTASHANAYLSRPI